MTIGELQHEIMRRAGALDHEPNIQAHMYRTATLLAGVAVLSRLAALAERAAPLIDKAVEEATGNAPRGP